MNFVEILGYLEDGRLLRARPEAEPSYSFKHNLIQQVAYESLLVQDRRALHLAVGETLERLYGDRRLEAAEVLGAHFAAAGESVKALDYTTQAAEQALRRFATAEAAVLFARAIELAGELEFDETRFLDLYQGRGRSLELAGDYSAASQLYEQLESLGQERGAARLELAGIIGAGLLRAVPTPLFNPAAALADAERAVALANAAGDVAGQARAYWVMMLAQSRIDAVAAVSAGNASLELARRHGLREQEAFTLNDIQADYQVLRQPERALQALEEARPIWRELDNLPMLADNLASTAMLHASLAEYDLAIARGNESLAISDRTGNLWGQSYGRIGISLSLFARGELGRAIHEMTRCIERAEQAGFLFPQVAIRSLLAIAYGEAGDLETAARLARRVQQVEERNPFPGQISGAAAQTWIASRQGELGKAKSLLDDIHRRTAGLAPAMLDSPVPLVIAEPTYYLASGDFPGALRSIDAFFTTLAWRAMSAPLLVARGRALIGLGRTTEAWDALSHALDEMSAQGIELGQWEAEAELGRLAQTRGDSSLAASLLHSSASRILGIAAGLQEVGLSDSFLSQARVRSIRDEAAQLSK